MTVTATPLRWSSVRDCARKAVYEATSAPHRERTLKEDRQLARGRAVGREYVVAIAAENRRTVHVCTGPDYMLPYPDHRATDENTADILAELQVQWELGTGHVDAYIHETDTVLEVLSSQHASGEMVQSKLLQAAGYARALDATSVCLAIVDPATLEDERVIVAKHDGGGVSEKWLALMVEVDDRVAEVLAWANDGRVPDRVCGKPGDAWGHFCTYAAHCFDQPPIWQPDPAAVLADEKTHQLVARDFHIRQKEREAKQTLRLIEEERKAVEQELAGLVDPGRWRVGSFELVRSARTRSSFKLALAEKDGRLPGPVLDEFTSVSSYDVWTVEKTGPAAVVSPDTDEAPF